MNNRTLLYIIGGFLILAIVLFGAVVACTPKKTKQTNQTVTLTFWTVFDDQEKLQPLIDKYQKKHPNVKIEYKKLTYAEYQQTLNDAFASGKGPDIFSVQNYWMPKFFDKIAPIPEKSYKTSDYQRDFYPAVSDTINNNRIYAIPITMDMLGMYVNEDLVRHANMDAPKTWEDLVGNTQTNKPNQLPKLNNRQGNTFNQSAIALGTTQVPRSADILALLMLQQKTQMTNANQTQATFNLSQTVSNKDVHLGTDALRFYTSFANPTTGNYSWNAQVGDPVAAFARGKVALFIGYTYNVAAIDRQNSDLNYSIKPVPQIAGTDPTNYANYWAEAVAKNSQHQAQAWDFIRFLTDADQMTQYTDAVQQMPARKGLNSGNSRLQELQKQLPTAKTWYKGDADKADQFFTRMITEVLGGEEPQNAIDRAANDLTVIYQQLQPSGK